MDDVNVISGCRTSCIHPHDDDDDDAQFAPDRTEPTPRAPIIVVVVVVVVVAITIAHAHARIHDQKIQSTSEKSARDIFNARRRRRRRRRDRTPVGPADKMRDIMGVGAFFIGRRRR